MLQRSNGNANKLDEGKRTDFPNAVAVIGFVATKPI
jgi:hypothetical protein